MSNELKPCPFCGGEAVAKFVSPYFVKEDYQGLCYVVGCKECGCSTSLYYSYKHMYDDEAKEQAIAAWNRRTNDE